jgi:transcriptional regulator with XRE-family HTH domain
MSSLGDRIRERRAYLNLSQSDLAERLDTSQKQVSKYENGINDPTARVLLVLAKELNTTADYLVGLTDDPNRPLRDTDDLTNLERDLIWLLRKKPDAIEKMIEFLKTVSA